MATRNSASVYGCRGSLSTRSAGPSSTSSPAYATRIRSHTSAITARSWLTSSSARSCSARIRASNSRTSAWTTTSSAVVASSATSRSGAQATATAISTRCSIPPERTAPGDLGGVVQPDGGEQLDGPLSGPRAVQTRFTLSTSVS
ncbi:hypothetical protein SANTM175S_05521 [Streptomyces antimycoticus]